MTAVLAFISLGLANILVLLRVVTLWDNNKTVSRMMWFGFTCSFSATLSLMAATISQIFGRFLTWNQFGGNFQTYLLHARWYSIQWCRRHVRLHHHYETSHSNMGVTRKSVFKFPAPLLDVTHTHRCYLRSLFSSSRSRISSIDQGQLAYAWPKRLLEMASISSWPLLYYDPWMLCLLLWTSPHWVCF